jgi:DNA-binding PadR family transcriptional regulator
MTIRQSILALLSEQPMYGAQLKAEFETRTGSTWPLNVGQVYTTVARLERDGLVQPGGEPAEEHRIVYALTDEGRRAASAWWADPVDRDTAPRSELAIKLALAVTVPGVDVASVVQVQRRATMRQLQDLTRLKRGAREPDGAGLAWSLVLESLVFAAEAEVRWLDHVESSLVRARRPRAESAGVAPQPGQHELQEHR